MKILICDICEKTSRQDKVRIYELADFARPNAHLYQIGLRHICGECKEKLDKKKISMYEEFQKQCEQTLELLVEELKHEKDSTSI